MQLSPLKVTQLSFRIASLIPHKSYSEICMRNCASMFTHNFEDQGSCFWQELLLHSERLILWGRQMGRGHKYLQEPTATALLGARASQNNAHGIHFSLAFNFQVIFSIQGLNMQNNAFSQSDPSSQVMRCVSNNASQSFNVGIKQLIWHHIIFSNNGKQQTVKNYFKAQSWSALLGTYKNRLMKKLH